MVGPTLLKVAATPPGPNAGPTRFAAQPMEGSETTHEMPLIRPGVVNSGVLSVTRMFALPSQAMVKGMPATVQLEKLSLTLPAVASVPSSRRPRCRVDRRPTRG